MKRILKKLSALLPALALTLGMSFTTFAADSSVTYEGGAEKFIFLPGSEYTDTDLFDNFKDVMPGDVLQESITVNNDYEGCDYVRIYMRAEVHDEDGNPMSEKVAAETDLVSMQDFLSQLSMKVWNGDELIYEASPDELDGLQDNVLLGEFAYGDSAELTVELDVPIELGNMYQKRVGEVDWVFTVEELNYPQEPEEPKAEQPQSVQPQTGDNTSIAGLVVVMVLAVVVIAVVAYRRFRKKA